MKKGLNFFPLVFILLISCQEEPSLYETISASEIIGAEMRMTDRIIDSTHGFENEIPYETILVFKTNEDNYGKMQILNNTVEANVLEFKYELFNDMQESILESEYSYVRRTWTFDFETNSEATDDEDFWWRWNQFNNGGQNGDGKALVPFSDCIFKIYPN